MRKYSFALLGLCLACVNAYAGDIGAGNIAAKGAVNYVTSGDKKFLLTAQPLIIPKDTPAYKDIITIDKTTRYQSFIGAGAALTDASAINLNRLDKKTRAAVMRELFSRSGLGFSFSRLTIGASDFSQSHYSLSDKKGEFSLLPIKKTIIPLAREAQRINPQLTFMASPWSAPAWMKTTDSMIGGTLKPENYDDHADYLLNYFDEMGKAGVKISMLTIQNEPDFSPPDYPGMKLSAAARADYFKNHLGPKLSARKNNPQILEWDHNWNEPEQPLEVLKDEGARQYLAGVAWHCYAGAPDAQSKIHAAYPAMDSYLTECSSGGWNEGFAKAFVWQMDNLIIGATNNWAKGVLMWNLVLDENYGPHHGGCSDCHGIMNINSKTKKITRNPEYYAFGHLSKFVRVGAIRIASSQNLEGLKNVAFENPDGSVALLVLNQSNSKRGFTVQIAGKYYNTQLSPQSATSMIFK